MPPKKDDTWKIPSKTGMTVIGFLLTGAISFNVWVAKSVHARPTTSEVRHLIEKESPYVQDRNMILSTLESIRDELREVKQLLRDRNGANN